MKDYTHNLLPARRNSGRWLVPAVILGLAVWLLLGLAAFAQSSGSIAGSEASADVDVTTGAIAGSAINNYGQKPGEDNRTYQEVATAPSLGGLALGGGHPCAYAPSSAQISVIGGGAGFGSMKVDSACMLMVMGAAGDAKAYKASQIMLAARDPLACFAMREAGMIAPESTCGDKRLRGTAAAPKKDFSAKGATASSKGANPGWGAKCDLQGRKLVFQPSSKEARGPELQACMARFKLR